MEILYKISCTSFKVEITTQDIDEQEILDARVIFHNDKDISEKHIQQAVEQAMSLQFHHTLCRGYDKV